jgi:Pentapeptide repeats (8 copies)
MRTLLSLWSCLWSRGCCTRRCRRRGSLASPRDRRIELETNRLRLQNDARATLAQMLAGGILLLGAYLTWRQLQVNREGQITDRYTRAIDQLGHDQLDVRLGGIYALERIARDSPADRATIGEVLTAFIRSHAPWPPTLPDQPAAKAPIGEVRELQVRAPDVQASLTVLGRGGFAPPASGRDRLDLHSVDLRRATLFGAHLEEAELFGIHLEGAFLSQAHLEGAMLPIARLEGTLLPDAHLEGAGLHEAHLSGAILGGARLERATLRGTHLEGALADERTVWPAGFDWRAAGVIVAGEDAAASPLDQT